VCVVRILVSLFAEVREQKVESGKGDVHRRVRYSQIIIAHEHDDSLFFAPTMPHERDNNNNNNNNNIKRRGGSDRPSNSRSDPKKKDHAYPFVGIEFPTTTVWETRLTPHSTNSTHLVIVDVKVVKIDQLADFFRGSR